MGHWCWHSLVPIEAALPFLALIFNLSPELRKFWCPVIKIKQKNVLAHKSLLVAQYTVKNKTALT